MSRTQGGNNNAYCQDNAVSWFDWTPTQRRTTRCSPSPQRCSRLRRELPVLRHNALAHRPAGRRTAARDIAWYSVWGLEMTAEEWDQPGGALRRRAAGRRASRADDAGAGPTSVLLLFNATDERRHLHAAARRRRDRRMDAAHRHRRRPLRARPRRARYAPPSASWSCRPHSMALLTQAAARTEPMRCRHDMPFGARLLRRRRRRASACGRRRARQRRARRSSAGAPRRSCMPAAARRATAGGNARCRDAGAGTLYRWRIDGELLVPDPASRQQPATARTARACVVDPLPFEWDDGLDAAGPGTRRCSTSCTSAPSRPKAPSPPPAQRLQALADAGHHRGGADAGGRLPRPLRLGLRRRAALRAARAPTARPTTSSAWCSRRTGSG